MLLTFVLSECKYSWRILDLSVAMAYSMLTTYGQKGRSVSAAAAMLRGYNSVYPVTNLELQHLHLLVACRLACSCTLGAYSFSQNPENEYLLLHAQPAWDALEFLWGDSDKHRASTSSALKTVFEQACRSDLAEKCSDLAFPDPGFVDPLASMRESGPPAKRRKPNGDEKPTITFVTGNKKKLEEVQRILGTDLPFDITNKKVDLPELQGDSLEIAKEKCLEAARLVGGAVITEDTSLCFTALKDLPGPYIKWFLEKCGHEGLNNMIGTYDDKSGYAQTVVAFCPGPDQEVVIFDGRTKGKIVPARGKLDFGWDAIFEPDEGKGLTYAEMNKDEKDAISHRSRAMMQLKDYFSNEKDAIKHSLA
jgi:inosine triphosphate pyrophosphatase